MNWLRNRRYLFGRLKKGAATAGVVGLLGLGASLTAMTVSANTGNTHATSTCSGFTADVYLDNNVNDRLVVVTSSFPSTTGLTGVYTTTSETELYAQTNPIWDASGPALTGISTVTLTIYNGTTTASGIEYGPPTAGYTFSVGAPTGCSAAPTLSTQLSTSSAVSPATVTDTATLSGANAGATGAITISAYSGSNVDACVAENLISSETASPTTDGNGPYTAIFSSLAAGSYEFQASYAGDASNSPAKSECDTEPLTVSRAASSITTLLSQSTTTVGGSVIDTATLSGATIGATGAITISAYSGSNVDACVARNLVGSSETALPATDGNGNYTASFSGLAVGSYEFQASYAGDGNNSPATSGCGSEPLTVNQAASSLSTELSSSTITVGGSVIDTAILSGATSGATGTITISAYSGTDVDACVADHLMSSETASPATDGNGSYTATFSGLAVGSYEFQAKYAGDVNNLPSESRCGSEPLTVNKAAPAITTALSAGTITVFGSVIDTATLSGASTGATGAIVISAYSGNSSEACVATNLVGTGETASPPTDGNGSYTATFSSLDAGSYEFQASYAGDGNNLSATSVCGTEPLTVNKATPAISTKLSSSTAPVHVSVTDTATLSGATIDASGTITISAFSGSAALGTSASACSGTAIVSETASPATDGNGGYTATFSSLAAGDYEFQASYAGDNNNQAAKSACGTEPLTVSSPVGKVLAASTTKTPTTGADLVGPGLAGALALLLGGLLIMVGTRVTRLRSR